MALTYNPYPTAVKFHNALNYVNRYIAGPPGSGKSVANFMELMAIALRQEPTPDGVRPTRFAIVRSTYGELAETTLETMKAWLPSSCTKYTMTQPIKVHTRLDLPDGTIADMQFRLIAIKDEGDLGKLDSAEYTAIWLNEITGLPKGLVAKATERVGRYPPSNLWDDGKNHCTYYGVIGDYNYPPRNHWIVDVFHKNKLPESTILFEQPPALLEVMADDGKTVVDYVINPAAENLVNLDNGKKYLIDLSNYLATKEYDKITTRLLCRYGKAGGNGRPVVTNFEYDVHVSEEELEVAQFTDTMVSVDTSGLHPCALFWQYVRGDWRILDGLYGEDMGFEEFVDDVITPFVTLRYASCRLLFVCDPADTKDFRTKTSPIDLLIERGYKAIPAVTNKFEPRRNAVASLLSKRGIGRVIINNTLDMLIEALEGGYQYKRLVAQSSGSDILFSTTPVKNKYSHWMDSMQYGALQIHMKSENKDTSERGRALARNSRR